MRLQDDDSPWCFTLKSPEDSWSAFTPGVKKKKRERLELGFIFRTYLCALRVDLKFS